METLMRRTTIRAVLTAILAAMCATGPSWAQTTAAAAKPSLKISGEVEKPLTLGADDLAKLPRRSVRAIDHSGKEAEFEGSTLAEILTLAGVKFGEGSMGAISTTGIGCGSRWAEIRWSVQRLKTPPGRPRNWSQMRRSPASMEKKYWWPRLSVKDVFWASESPVTKALNRSRKLMASSNKKRKH
jgi:hypothetical protein